MLWIRTSFDTGSSWRTMLSRPRAVAAQVPQRVFRWLEFEPALDNIEGL